MKHYIVKYLKSVSILSTINNIKTGNYNFDYYSEITNEKALELKKALKNNNILYLDNNNQPQTRSRFAKWDESQQKWLIDNKLVEEDKILQLKFQAQQALNNTVEYESESYKELCTEEQNAANFAYRVQLRKIMKNMYNGTELPIDPNKKE